MLSGGLRAQFFVAKDLALELMLTVLLVALLLQVA
jgi:hypothetical protein